MAKSEVQPIRTDADKVTNRANLNDEMDFFAKHTGSSEARGPTPIQFDTVNDVDPDEPVPDLVAGAATAESMAREKELRPILSALTLITVSLCVAGFWILRRRFD